MKIYNVIVNGKYVILTEIQIKHMKSNLILYPGETIRCTETNNVLYLNSQQLAVYDTVLGAKVLKDYYILQAYKALFKLEWEDLYTKVFNDSIPYLKAA